MLRSLPSLVRAGGGAAASRRQCNPHRATPSLTARAFSSSPPKPDKDDTDTKDGPQRQRHSSGVSTEYLWWRGLTIAARTLWRLPDFFRYSDNGVFQRSADDSVRSAMFVLTQFPKATRVDLERFVQGAERVAHTVFEQLYAPSGSKMQYLECVVTPEAINAFVRKPSAPMGQGSSRTKRHCVLEQLNMNNVTLRAVQYTSKRLGQQSDSVEQEWLAFEVEYNVTEHLLSTPEDETAGIEDRRAINTRFAWTFEADVTQPEEVEWFIAEATPFEEKAAVLAPKGEANK